MDSRVSPGSHTAPDALPTRGRVLVRAAAVYDQVQPFVTLGQEARLNTWLARQINLPAHSQVLDIGCGTGLLTVRIAEQHPQVDVVGIDASKPMIAVANKKRAGRNCHFQQALGEDLPFPESHFDLVTSALFFHHVDRDLKQRTLQEIRRVLKPGGMLLIADMDRPYTALGWAMSWTAWKLLRQPEIKENMDGVLREEIDHAGFVGQQELGKFSGYIRVFQAQRGL